MPIFSINVRFVATAYIRADDEAAAMEEAIACFKQTSFELPTGDIGDGIEISGLPYDSEDLPDVSLSPAVTCEGPCADETPERADDDDDDDAPLPEVPANWPVQPLEPWSSAYTVAEAAGTLATCGGCGRSWDDGVATSMTPVPSARCPFEAFHRSAS